MTQVFIPSGKISAKRREFKAIVADIRHAVFSVVRQRPVGELFQSYCLGSGFFVSSSVFVTCWHVIDSPLSPHIAGDKYQLVNNVNGTNGIVLEIVGGIGEDIHLYPESDFAILLCRAKSDQAYMPIGYATLPVGSEIGTAGYPLASISANEDMTANVEGLIYRVAKSATTAVYKSTWNANDGYPLVDATLVEVNFFFVPGNSGGPIFDAETGRAFAYVKGFKTPKINEFMDTAFITPPDHVSKDYIAGIRAVYSIGLTLDPVREHLEKFGVKL